MLSIEATFMKNDFEKVMTSSSSMTNKVHQINDFVTEKLSIPTQQKELFSNQINDLLKQSPSSEATKTILAINEFVTERFSMTTQQSEWFLHQTQELLKNIGAITAVYVNAYTLCMQKIGNDMTNEIIDKLTVLDNSITKRVIDNLAESQKQITDTTESLINKLSKSVTESLTNASKNIISESDNKFKEVMNKLIEATELKVDDAIETIESTRNDILSQLDTHSQRNDEHK